MNARIILLLLCIACAVYTGFVYRFSDTKPNEEVVRTAAQQGLIVWQEKNCQSCHQLYGLGGYMGPDLTNVAAKGRPYMQSFMAHGTPRMPDFHLTSRQIDELTSFLQWVDSSGQTRVSPAAVHWTGSYSLNP